MKFVGKNANAPQEEILRRVGHYVRRWDRWVLSGVRVSCAFQRPVELAAQDAFASRRYHSFIESRSYCLNSTCPVARMMRADNLLEIENRELRRATGPHDGLEIYLNLASRVKVCGPNQVWIADITYIRLKGSIEKKTAGFCFVPGVLQAVSREEEGA